MVVGFVSTRQQHVEVRHRELRRLAHPGSAQPDRRRRQLQRLRHAVRDAHLARPEQAQQLRADAPRRDQRAAEPERADLRRPARRHAGAVANQQLTATITEATLLRTPEEFGAILLKVLPDGSQVRLRDVARIELGAENFAIDTQYNGQPASGIGIQLATGANALATANAVRARIDEL